MIATQFGGERLQLGGIGTGQRKARPLRRQALRNGGTKATTGTGHEGGHSR